MQKQQMTSLEDCPAFSDDKESFDLVNQHTGFCGDKIKIDRVIGKKVVFLDFVVLPSQYRRFGDNVTMIQIILDGEHRVLFTQSKHITRALEIFKDKLPRCGTIIKEDRALKIS